MICLIKRLVSEKSIFEWEWTPNAQWYQVDYFPHDGGGSNYLHLLWLLYCVLVFGLPYYYHKMCCCGGKNKFCITWRRAEMQMKWRGIMGILKDHKSYVLVPEMKEFTDLMTAYPFWVRNHLVKCVKFNTKFHQSLKAENFLLLYFLSVSRPFRMLSVVCFSATDQNAAFVGVFIAIILFTVDSVWLWYSRPA